MFRHAAALVFLGQFAAPAFAEDVPWFDTTGRYVGVYICIPEVSGGIYYDDQAKEWRSGSFKPGENVIFRLKDGGARRPIHSNPDAPAVGYEVTINIPGEQDPMTCYPREVPAVFVMEGRTMCFAFASIYKLDFNSMRYMHIYTYGYTDGVDTRENTPLITVGKCSKLE